MFIAQAEPSIQDVGFPTFYYFATSLTVGVTAMLPLIPVRQIGRKFFILLTLIAVVFYALALCAHGLSIEYFHAGTAGILILYNIFVSEKGGILSMVLLLMACGCGAAGLISDAVSYPVAVPLAVAPTFMVSLSFLSSALVLGGALVSMLLGHWYLVVHGLSFKYLDRTVNVLLAALLLRCVIIVAIALAQHEHWSQLWSNSGGATGFFLSTGMFIGARGLFGLAVPLVLALMARSCVKIESNQSATGILYVVVAFTLIGEAIAKHLLVSSQLLI